MMKLYQIREEYESVLNELYDPDTGEINESSFDRLNKVKESLETKAIAVSAFIKNMDAERIAIAHAVDEMQTRQKLLENKVASLKEYLKYNMEQAGHLEISCPYFTIKVRKNPVSVEVLDETLIPERFKRIKQVVSVDKIGIKAAIQDGLDIQGAKLKQDTSIIIK